MNSSRTMEDVMQDWNNRADAEGSLLGKAFWEIPKSQSRMQKGASSPEAQERVRKVQAEIDAQKQAEINRGRRQTHENITAAYRDAAFDEWGK